MSRSQIIREVENDLIAARTRGMLKTPQHPGMTEQEYLSHWHLQVWHVALLAALILSGVALVIGLIVL